MHLRDKLQFWHNRHLNIDLMDAMYVEYEYPPHTHDHYVICLLEWGTSAFYVSGKRYTSPANGLVLINPGEVHTGGDATTKHGLKTRSLYPALEHMQGALQMDGHPVFRSAYVHDALSARAVYDLHQRLAFGCDPLEQETLLIETLRLLVARHAYDGLVSAEKIANEKPIITKAKRFLEARYAAGVSLQELAEHTGYSKHYLLRVFRDKVGMPPHEYLQNIRMQRAKQLIRAGKPLSEVGTAIGLVDQSHLNRIFKRFTGMTPGAFAKQVRV